MRRLYRKITCLQATWYYSFHANSKFHSQGGKGFPACAAQAKHSWPDGVTPKDKECGTAAPGCSIKEQAGRLLHIFEKFFTVKPAATEDPAQSQFLFNCRIFPATH
jgi:hypothetical protein